MWSSCFTYPYCKKGNIFKAFPIFKEYTKDVSSGITMAKTAPPSIPDKGGEIKSSKALEVPSSLNMSHMDLLKGVQSPCAKQYDTDRLS